MKKLPVLVPRSDNFTPPSRTPWGGDKISSLKKHLGVVVDGIVGESWEISGHSSFPNVFHIENKDVSLCELGELFPDQLYGPGLSKMPFLLKILNSGGWIRYIKQLPQKFQNIKNYHDLHVALSNVEDDSIRKIHSQMLEKNLSIQVHPPKRFSENSKTEAWIILEAEGGAGIYLGLKEGISKDEFNDAMLEGNDVSCMLNFVPVKHGDIYFIPAGTLHAIGAGILLLEPQETSEETFRAYDWGRLYNGKSRELHFAETMKVTNWNDLKGEKIVAKLKQKPKLIQPKNNEDPQIEILLGVLEFQCYRITFDELSQIYNQNVFKGEGVKGYLVTEGSIEVNGTTINAWQSFIIPSAFEDVSIRVKSKRAVIYNIQANPHFS